jgi:prevent-host-death family protein
MCYIVHMRSIGVRELRQNASEYLRLVEAGESIQITTRGKPVAMLTAIPRDESLYHRLVREGRLQPAIHHDLPEPLPPEPGKPTLSEILKEVRADER